MGHLTWPLNPPKKTNKTKKQKQKNKKNKEGLGPSEVALRAKTKKKKQKSKQKKEKKKFKNTKIPKNQKKLFSYQSKFSFFWGGVQKLPFLTTWPRKRAPPKHIKNRGFSLFFEKKLCVTIRPFLDQKNPNPEIPIIIFFCLFSLSTTKNTKISWNPYFYSVLANLKKENFQILNLKHRKLKNPIFAPFFWKRLVLDNCQIIGHKKKTQNDNCVCQKSLETTIFIG